MKEEIKYSIIREQGEFFDDKPLTEEENKIVNEETASNTQND